MSAIGISTKKNPDQFIIIYNYGVITGDVVEQNDSSSPRGPDRLHYPEILVGVLKSAVGERIHEWHELERKVERFGH